LDVVALNLVKHVAVTDENYVEAWDKLLPRYDNMPLITRSFIAGLLGPMPKYTNILENWIWHPANLGRKGEKAAQMT